MTDTSLLALAARISALEDIAAVKDVQYEYWRSVDLKQPDRLRTVFAEGEIYINFPDMPIWRDRDAFVDFFIELGMDPTRQENHHGLSPRVRLTGENTAEGEWRLHMFAYDFQRRLLIRISGEYEASYVRQNGSWRIKTLIFHRRSLHTESVGPAGEITAVEFGGVAADAAAYLFGAEK